MTCHARSRLLALVVLLTAVVSAFGCSRSEQPPPRATAPSATAHTASSKAPSSARRETAVLAGGCFWGMEELLRKLPGVIDTSVGYTGGSAAAADYEQVHTGATGHAESVRVVFDPEELSYERLLLYFFTIHDPTTQNRQGNDVGTQYRSAIFVNGPEQRRVAERVVDKVADSGDWNGEITTQILDAKTFYPAEDHHQDYLQKNPGGYTCHYERETTFY